MSPSHAWLTGRMRNLNAVLTRHHDFFTFESGRTILDGLALLTDLLVALEGVEVSDENALRVPFRLEEILAALDIVV